MNKKNEGDEVDRQTRLIHSLAVRLPWIVVIISLLAAVVTLIEIFIFGQAKV